MQCAPIAPSALARDRSNRVRISAWVAARSGRALGKALGKDLRSAISKPEDGNRVSPIVNLVKDAIAIQADAKALGIAGQRFSALGPRFTRKGCDSAADTAPNLTRIDRFDSARRDGFDQYPKVDHGAANRK